MPLRPTHDAEGNPIKRVPSTLADYTKNARQGLPPINYSRRNLSSRQLLELPEANDSLIEIERKMRLISDAIHNGDRIAVRSGYTGAEKKERDLVKAAMDMMRGEERMMLSAFLDGRDPPAFDWATCRQPLKGGPAQKDRIKKRMIAAREIWGTDVIDMENIQWLMVNAPELIPLIVGAVKVQASRKALIGGTILSAVEIAELQTLQKTVSTAMTVVNQVIEANRRSTRAINIHLKAVSAREKALRSKLNEVKAAQVPLNQKRAAMGLPEIGVNLDFSKVVQGKRIGRTNLMAGVGLKKGGVDLSTLARDSTGPSRVRNKRARFVQEKDDVVELDYDEVEQPAPAEEVSIGKGKEKAIEDKPQSRARYALRNATPIVVGSDESEEGEVSEEEIRILHNESKQ